jgi:hypothetical protein
MVRLWVVLFILFFQNCEAKMSNENIKGREPLPPPEAIANLPADGGKEFNRLIFEKSPYLLQHARNPVDWYPWGDEAFAKAKAEDKPIFLSIGYSTCHWCHVMEHESFEDHAVAELMNQAFVCIKVDREERPDIDHIYMAVCQAMTGSGGWPLTIIMTPDKRPFFAGTYYPRESMGQRIGMLDLVPRVAEVWQHKRDELFATTDKVQEYLEKIATIEPGEALREGVLELAFEQLSQRFDAKYGGFGSAPKFPTPHNLTFLLRYWFRSKDDSALKMVEKTLHQMRLGGIFDQVGFGFHRYSTDQVWLLPHFEKMLYDQALMTIACVEAYQVTRKEEYAQTAREVITYVLRDMTSPEGGFYSAEDADSEGEEGLFYHWTQDQLDEILGEKDGQLFGRLFNVEPGGNFHDQATGQKTGSSILHLKKSLAEHAAGMAIAEAALKERWEKARQKLFEVRERRIHPLKDDKILTDWNGLMIAALAKASVVLQDETYRHSAQKAADFIWQKVRTKTGRLQKRYRGGEAGMPAHAEDYAFIIWGLLELYEATFDVKSLARAIELNRILLTEFWDEKHGGFFFTSDSSERLLVRNKEIYDGAIPSANSVATLNLLRIGRITGNATLESKAIAIGKAFSAMVSQGPMGHTQLMNALLFSLGPSYEVVIAGDTGDQQTTEMLHALREPFFPNKVILFRPDEEERPAIVDIAAFTENQRSLDGKPTAYVCKNYACNAPTTDVKGMLELLVEGE